MNDMQDLSRESVQAVADDESEAIVKRRAAERILDAKDMWNAVDYTNHRPVQKNENYTDVVLRTPDDRAVEAATASDRLRAILDPSEN